MNCSVLSVGKMNQIHSIFLAVHRANLGALLAVINHNLVIFAAGNQSFSTRRKVNTVDFVGVLPENFRHPKAADHLVDEFHFHEGLKFKRGDPKPNSEKR